MDLNCFKKTIGQSRFLSLGQGFGKMANQANTAVSFAQSMMAKYIPDGQEGYGLPSASLFHLLQEEWERGQETLKLSVRILLSMNHCQNISFIHTYEQRYFQLLCRQCTQLLSHLEENAWFLASAKELREYYREICREVGEYAAQRPDTNKSDTKVSDRKRLDIKSLDKKNADTKNADARNTDIRNADARNADIRNADTRNADARNTNTKRQAERNQKLQQILSEAEKSAKKIDSTIFKNADIHKNIDTIKNINTIIETDTIKAANPMKETNTIKGTNTIPGETIVPMPLQYAADTYLPIGRRLNAGMISWKSEQAKQFFWRVQRASVMERQLILAAAQTKTIVGLFNVLKKVEEHKWADFAKKLRERLWLMAEDSAGGFPTVIPADRTDTGNVNSFSIGNTNKFKIENTDKANTGNANRAGTGNDGSAARVDVKAETILLTHLRRWFQEYYRETENEEEIQQQKETLLQQINQEWRKIEKIGQDAETAEEKEKQKEYQRTRQLLSNSKVLADYVLPDIKESLLIQKKAEKYIRKMHMEEWKKLVNNLRNILKDEAVVEDYIGLESETKATTLERLHHIFFCLGMDDEQDKMEKNVFYYPGQYELYEWYQTVMEAVSYLGKAEWTELKEELSASLKEIHRPISAFQWMVEPVTDAGKEKQVFIEMLTQQMEEEAERIRNRYHKELPIKLQEQKTLTPETVKEALFFRLHLAQWLWENNGKLRTDEEVKLQQKSLLTLLEHHAQGVQFLHTEEKKSASKHLLQEKHFLQEIKDISSMNAKEWAVFKQELSASIKALPLPAPVKQLQRSATEEDLFLSVLEENALPPALKENMVLPVPEKKLSFPASEESLPLAASVSKMPVSFIPEREKLSEEKQVWINYFIRQITENIKAAEQIQLIKQIQATDRIQLTEQIQAAERVQITEQIQAAERVQLTEQIQAAEQIPITGKIKATEIMQHTLQNTREKTAPLNKEEHNFFESESKTEAENDDLTRHSFIHLHQWFQENCREIPEGNSVELEIQKQSLLILLEREIQHYQPLFSAMENEPEEKQMKLWLKNSKTLSDSILWENKEESVHGLLPVSFVDAVRQMDSREWQEWKQGFRNILEENTAFSQSIKEMLVFGNSREWYQNVMEAISYLDESEWKNFKQELSVSVRDTILPAPIVRWLTGEMEDNGKIRARKEAPSNNSGKIAAGKTDARKEKQAFIQIFSRRMAERAESIQHQYLHNLQLKADNVLQRFVQINQEPEPKAADDWHRKATLNDAHISLEDGLDHLRYILEGESKEEANRLYFSVGLVHTLNHGFPSMQWLNPESGNISLAQESALTVIERMRSKRIREPQSVLSYRPADIVIARAIGNTGIQPGNQSGNLQQPGKGLSADIVRQVQEETDIQFKTRSREAAEAGQETGQRVLQMEMEKALQRMEQRQKDLEQKLLSSSPEKIQKNILKKLQSQLHIAQMRHGM